MTALVWYCQNARCRKAIKVEPRYLKATWTMCRCKRPSLSTFGPTRVTWG